MFKHLSNSFEANGSWTCVPEGKTVTLKHSDSSEPVWTQSSSSFRAPLKQQCDGGSAWSSCLHPQSTSRIFHAYPLYGIWVHRLGILGIILDPQAQVYDRHVTFKPSWWLHTSGFPYVMLYFEISFIVIASPAHPVVHPWHWCTGRFILAILAAQGKYMR